MSSQKRPILSIAGKPKADMSAAVQSGQIEEEQFKTAAECVQRIVELRDGRHFMAALGIAERGLKKFHGSVDLTVQCVNLLCLLKRPEEALPIITQAVEDNPKNKKLARQKSVVENSIKGAERLSKGEHYDMVKTALTGNKFRQVVRLCRNALDDYPSYSYFWLSYMNALWRLKMPKELGQVALQAKEYNHCQSRHQTNCLSYMLRAGLIAEAVKHGREMLVHHKGDPFFLTAFAQALHVSGEAQEALVYAQQAHAMCPEDKKIIHLMGEMRQGTRMRARDGAAYRKS